MVTHGLGHIMNDYIKNNKRTTLYISMKITEIKKRRLCAQVHDLL